MNNSGKTAISRTEISGPMRWLLKNGLVNRGDRVLDCGCGHGKDADDLGFDGWDPNHRNGTAHLVGNGDYPVVTSIYVLNTIPDEKERIEAEDAVIRSLAPYGVAYLAVRNDRKYLNGWTSKGTWQGVVEPSRKDWKIVRECSHFRIWKYVNAPSTECGVTP